MGDDPSRKVQIEEIFAVDTLDLFRSMDGVLQVRKILVTTDGISQACFGLPHASEFSHPDYEWFLKKAFSASLFFRHAKKQTCFSFGMHLHALRLLAILISSAI